MTGVPGGSLPPIEPQAALGVARSVVSALAPAVTSLAFSVLIVIYVLLGAKGLHGRTLRATSAEVIARYDALATELVTYVKVRAVAGGRRRPRRHGRCCSCSASRTPSCGA